jgi:hypothetical protein
LKKTTFNDPDLAVTAVLVSVAPDFLDEKCNANNKITATLKTTLISKLRLFIFYIFSVLI